MRELKLEELLLIDGGNCSWKGAGLAAIRGAYGSVDKISGAINGVVDYTRYCRRWN